MKNRFTKASLAVVLGTSLLGTSLVPAMAAETTNPVLEMDLTSHKAGEATALEFVFDTTLSGTKYGQQLSEIQFIMPMFQIPEGIDVSDISINGLKPKSVETSNGMIKITLDDEQKTTAFAKNVLVSIRKEAGILNPNRSTQTQVTAFLKYSSGNSSLNIYSGSVKIDQWSPSTLPSSVSMLPNQDSSKPIETTAGFEVDLSSTKAGEETSIELEFDTDVENKNKYGMPIDTIQLFLPQFQLPAAIETDDILVNGMKPEKITVSNGMVELKMPANNTSLMSSKVLVLIRNQAKVKNPNQAQNTLINAFVRFQQGTQSAMTLKAGLKIDPWTPSEYPDGLIYEPTPTPTPTPDPKPEPTPEPPKEEIVEKELSVIVQIGSNIGGYKSVVGEKETDKMLTFDAAPFIKDGSTLVPLRFMSEGLGADVNYDNLTQTVTLEFEDKTIQLKAGSKDAVIDGKSYSLPVAPVILNGSMVVPLRFVSESFGAEVKWTQATQVITVTKTTTEKVVVQP